MKLVSLSANKSTFRTVKFNRSGITLILGRKGAASTRKGSFNGVGKSLIIRLVHFCLGCNAVADFEKKLAGWEFTLTVEIGGIEHKLKRSTDNQGKIGFDNEELDLTKFKESLENRIFSFEPGLSLSFRSLINRFIRQDRAAYVEADTFVSEEKDYYKLLNNAFLLGLDPDLIKKKHDLRESSQKIKVLKGNFDKDLILKEFYSGGKNADIELQALLEKIDKLEDSLKEFNVAENYHAIRKEADDYSSKIQELENHRSLLEISISNIEKSIKTRPDIPREKVTAVYEEAKFVFKEEFKKSLDDVLAFQAQLISNRRKRLLNEKARLRKDIKKNEARRLKFGELLDQTLKFLGSHRALDEFISLTNFCSELRSKAQKLKDYQELVKRYDAKLHMISLDMKKEDIGTDTYLEKSSKVLNGHHSLFRVLSKEFYKDKASGITIKNNVGNNLTRFDIDVRIQHDSSDGINEVKLFCFDMTLLKAKQGHQVDFIFHDSRLFANMDPRQRATLFKLAYQQTEDGMQYIASVNQDQLASIEAELSPEEYKKYISDSVALELTDERTASKLLGIEVDIDYEP